jgi:hypothetical protein
MTGQYQNPIHNLQRLASEVTGDEVKIRGNYSSLVGAMEFSAK